MSWETGPEAKHSGNIFLGKLSAVALGEGGQVRRMLHQGCGDRAIALAVYAVARGTVLLVHLTASRNVSGRQLGALNVASVRVRHVESDEKKSGDRENYKATSHMCLSSIARVNSAELVKQ